MTLDNIVRNAFDELRSKRDKERKALLLLSGKVPKGSLLANVYEVLLDQLNAHSVELLELESKIRDSLEEEKE